MRSFGLEAAARPSSHNLDRAAPIDHLTLPLAVSPRGSAVSPDVAMNDSGRIFIVHQPPADTGAVDTGLVTSQVLIQSVSQ